MKLSLALLALFAVVSSAFELPTVMNRRAALARIAAAAPLAALAQQAQAARVSNAAISANWMESASSNTVLGVAKPGSVYGSAEPVLKSIGRPATVDEFGSAVPKSAKYSAGEAANRVTVTGEQKVPASAYARLLAK